MKRHCFFCKDLNMDERQLLMRGNVFQHTTILLLGLVLVNGMLKEEGISWAKGYWENLLIIWPALTLAMCEYILRDITPAGTRQDILYILLGLCGGVLVVLSLIHLLAEGRPFIEDGMLSPIGGGLLSGCCMLAVFLTFLAKRLHDRRAGAGDVD